MNKNICEVVTTEAVLRWIQTQEGREVRTVAEQILQVRRSEFVDDNGFVPVALAKALCEEAWRMCPEAEDVIELPFEARFWVGSSIPLTIVFDWLERRYGPIIKICASLLLARNPSCFTEAGDLGWISNPFKLREQALQLAENGATFDLAHDFYMR